MRKTREYATDPNFRKWMVAFMKQLKKSGMTYAQIAVRCGISHGFLSDIITGRRFPSVEFCSKLCTAYEILEQQKVWHDKIYNQQHEKEAI